MSAPPKPYTLGYSFTDWATNNPSLPLPGGRLDTELRSLKTTTDQLISRLGEIQRDDGKLRNGSVHKDTLDSSTKAMLGATAGTPRGLWLTGTSYAVRDLVDEASITYIATVAHTSGDFAADLAGGKWIAVNVSGADFGDATTAGVQAAAVAWSSAKVPPDELPEPLSMPPWLPALLVGIGVLFVALLIRAKRRRQA